MRKFLASVLLSLMPLQSAAATSADLAPVVSHYLTDEFFDKMRPGLAIGFVKPYEEMLRQHSVMQLDKTRFAEMLPKHLTDDMVKEMRAALVQKCFEPLSPHDRALLADGIATGAASSETYVGSEVQKIEFALVVCITVTGLKTANEMPDPSSLLPDAYNADILRILQTPGMARFPNRIIKQDVLRLFR